MKKILHVIDLSKTGGVEVMFMQFIYEAIKWRDYQHLVFAIRITSERKNALEALGVTVFSSPNDKFGLFRRLSIARIIRQHNIDFVYGQNFTGNFWAFIGKLLSFRNSIFITHEHGSTWGARYIVKILSFCWVASCNKIICNSQAAAIIIKRRIYSKAPTVTVHNGIDTTPFSDHITQKTSNDPYRVLFVGRLTYVKGVHTLIATAEIVIDRYPQVIFTLVGDGSLRGELEKTIKIKDLTKKIILLGIRNDVPKLMLSSDLLVLPSIREPFGNVLIEAGLAKLPVISTKIDGVPEIIQNGVNGYLIEPTVPVDYKSAPRFVVKPPGTLGEPMAIDTYELADKIIYLIKHRDVGYKLGQNGFRLAKNNAINNYTQNIKDLLETLYITHLF